MNVSWADATQALCAAATLVVALIGLPLLVYQLRQLERSIQGDTQEKLFSREHEIMTILAERPHVRALLLQGDIVPESNPDRQYVSIIVAMMGDFCELVWLHRSNMEQGIWGRWQSYLRHLHRKSAELRKYYSDNASWYSPEFISFIQKDGD